MVAGAQEPQGVRALSAGPDKFERSTARGGAQDGAQDGAQLTLGDVAPMSYEADVMLRVMGRKGVTNERLAKLSGISSGVISRYLSGQYPVPVSVIRSLLAETNDADLLELLAPDSLRLISVPRNGASTDLRTAFIAAIKSTHHAQAIAAELFAAPAPTTRQQLLDSIDGMFVAFANLRAAAQENAA